MINRLRDWECARSFQKYVYLTTFGTSKCTLQTREGDTFGQKTFSNISFCWPGSGTKNQHKNFQKGVFVKHPSKKVVSFWCWCEGQLKPTVRVFFPPRTPNDWPIGTRLPQNLTLIKSCCSSSATIMATDLMGNQVVFFILNGLCVTHHHSPRLR